jgi:hypothetical protein
LRAEATALIVEIVQTLLGFTHSDKEDLLLGGQLSRIT